MTTLSRLFQSRKFLVVFFDVIVGLVSLSLTEFVAPETTKFVLAVIGIMQPAVLMYIDAVGKEDAAAKGAGNFQGTFK